MNERVFDGVAAPGTDRLVEDRLGEEASMVVFSGNANRPLAEAVVQRLNMPLGKAIAGRFSDGDIWVFNDPYRGGTHLNDMKLVKPFFSAKVVANMIVAAGADRVLTMDLHADQIQGFFSIPVDNIYASPVLLGDIYKHEYENLMVVSPDVGGVVRARALAKRLDDADLAIIDKRRPRENEAEVMNIIGEVNGRTCVIVDDMADTAGTLCNAAAALKDHGALRVVAYCTHAVLSGKAVDNVKNSVLDELVVTDTIPLDQRATRCKKIRQLSIAELIAESIRRIHSEESIGSLFRD